jgi:hypothetical protein
MMVKKRSQADMIEGSEEGYYSFVSGWAIIAQYPTAQEAHEEAGTRKSAFSWGRFMIFGDPEVVEEIRKRL